MMATTVSGHAAGGAGRRAAARTADALLRLATAAGLAVDGFVHADLAPAYDAVRGGVSQGGLFRVEAAVAALAALLVLVAGRRPAVWVFALLVAAAGVGAVLLYRFADVGAVGPLPDMYEPLWYPEKTASAVAEGAAGVTALAGFFLARSNTRRSRA